MKFKEYLSTIYNEIISPEEWEQKYKKHSPETTKKYQEQTVPRLQAVFTTLNDGTFSPVAIYDFDATIDSARNRIKADDKRVIEFLKSVGYECNDNTYKLGICVKAGKEFSISAVIKEWEHRKENKEKMKEAFERTKNPSIKQQLDLIERFEKDALDKIRLKKGHLSERKIVFSMEPRKIASQSTKVGWRSCMNLDSGMYRRFVKSGMVAGQFIAFLAEVGDEEKLDFPKARVLIKPMKSGKYYYYVVDKAYPDEAPKSFRKQVEKIINEKINANAPSGDYAIVGSQYEDDIQSTHIHLTAQTQNYIKKGDYSNFKSLPKNEQKLIVRRDDTLLLKTMDLSDITILNSLQWFPEQFVKIQDKIPASILHSAQEIVIQRRPLDIQYIKDPSPDIIEIALLEDSEAIKFIDKKRLTQSIVNNAIDNHADLLFHFINPKNWDATPDRRRQMIRIAIEEDPDIIDQIYKYNNNPAHKTKIEIDDELIKRVIQKDPSVIENLKKPSEDLQLYAIQKAPVDGWDTIDLSMIDGLTVNAATAAMKKMPKQLSEIPYNLITSKNKIIGEAILDHYKRPRMKSDFLNEFVDADYENLYRLIKLVGAKDILTVFPEVAFFASDQVYDSGPRNDIFTMADRMYALSIAPNKILSELDAWMDWTPSKPFFNYIKRKYPKQWERYGLESLYDDIYL